MGTAEYFEKSILYQKLKKDFVNTAEKNIHLLFKFVVLIVGVLSGLHASFKRELEIILKLLQEKDIVTVVPTVVPSANNKVNICICTVWKAVIKMWNKRVQERRSTCCCAQTNASIPANVFLIRHVSRRNEP